MKKQLLLAAFLFACITSFAQQKTEIKSQYLLIIRFKTDFKPVTDTTVSVNIKHWQAYMGGLAKSGKIAGGYRPSGDGITISGTEKVLTNAPYTANNDLVSSVLIINADDLNDAKAIAAKCPALELGGSVEVRPIMNTASK
jgi:hypothetical protein